jgi:steroid delta-isomerase-like uncharacterized protein
MTRDQIALVFERRRLALERQDVVTLLKDYADDCIVESPSAGVHTGKQAIEEALRAIFGALDVKVHQQSLLIDGTSVAQVVLMEGKDVGEFLGLPPTGRSFRAPAVFLYEMNDLKIAHERRIYDFTGLLLQIGLLKAKPAI